MISLWLLLKTPSFFLPKKEGGDLKKTRVSRQRKVPARGVRDVNSAPTEKQVESQASRYQLRQKRQPRYKGGTCGLRDCVCILAVNENRKVPIGVRGVPPEKTTKRDLVHRIVVRAEKTFAAVERIGNHSAELVLQQIAVPGVAKAPCPRFKEWTSDGKGLEFTLATVVPPVPPNIVFGPFNSEREPVQECPGALLLTYYSADMGRIRAGWRLQPRPVLVVIGDRSTR